MSALRAAAVVTTQWLAEKLASNPANFRVLDGSWHMPFTRRNPRQEFYQKHIPGAQFYDIDDCCDKSTDMEHMVPKPEMFSEYVGKLGICNNTHVVVYDNNNTFGMLSAQRVWWTFRLFGHNNISILDGGLPKWEQDGYDVIDEVTYVEPEKFDATFNSSMVKSFDDLVANLEEKKFQVLDARPAGRFEGTSPEPRAGIKPGHMPGSINLPFASLMDPEKKILKSPEELKEVFRSKGIDLASQGALTASCGSGISACMIVLGAYLCGKDDMTVYDGSWTEWFQKAKRDHIISAK